MIFVPVTLIPEKEPLVQYIDFDTHSVKADKRKPGPVNSRTARHWLIVGYQSVLLLSYA